MHHVGADKASMLREKEAEAGPAQESGKSQKVLRKRQRHTKVDPLTVNGVGHVRQEKMHCATI